MQRGTMKGCLIWRKDRGAYYGKWLVDGVQILRRLGRNRAKSKAMLGKIVNAINKRINEEKRNKAMKGE